MATAMTTTMPRQSRSFNASKPPTSALPALPTSLNTKPSINTLRRTSLLPTNSPGRSLSGSFGRPSSIISPTSPIEPKRAVSISTSSFPQPPKGGNRVASLPPPSPSAFPKNTSGFPSSPLASPTRKSNRDSILTPMAASTKNPLSSRVSRDSMRDSGVGFLNSPSAGPGDFPSSPTRSRSSSAQDSYSTDPTTVDMSGGFDLDAPRGRTEERDGGDEKEMKGNVIVSVRVRPDGPEEQMSQEWVVDGRYSQVGYRGKDGGTFEYDNVFTPSSNNAQVYESCAKRLVRRVMEGYHGTVFAYGMTGTGKTFSMQGTTASPGVIPLAVTDIFSYIRETPHREFLLRVSYLEIYNERIHDLLASQPGATGFVPLDQQTKGEEIKLREDPKRGVYATPLKEEIVQSPTQLLKVIARGDLCRKVSSTQFNSRSSRSHAVVQIVVESRDRVAGQNSGSLAENRRGGMNGGVRVSTLSLIDLAGSERAAESKERRTEGAHINKSLLTLGSIIARLAKDAEKAKDDGSHLPYRDSKLTRLLQPALAGNSLISILCTVSVPLATASGAAHLTNIGETMNTLKFAARAKNNIRSHAKKGDDAINGADPASRALLERYRAEIAELRRELEAQRKKDEVDTAREFAKELAIEHSLMEERDQERHSEQLLEMQLARTALKERIEHLNRLIICSKSSGVNSPRSSMIALPAGGHLSMLSMRSSAPLNMVRHSSSSSLNTSEQDEMENGEFGEDGNATMSAQIRSLQADLGDKNRYIATLERRLLQARRSSQPRTAFDRSPHRMTVSGGEQVVAEGRVELLLKEKDDEIAELRARLDDKERMVSALRSAARKRDVADVVVRRSSCISEEGSPVGKRGSSRSSKGLLLGTMEEEVGEEREDLF
ncbi:kinesin motor domain-containing protein [Pyronema domesticum]|uniref:Kinesin-like protein n=1 Tax=Pyronema omphalodes (strain CBS 100304) TaxID=1076935 RepID=U4L3K1_PYROM|nr:kinesin motor domain-containing protein [Pyronema domesticum]CCX10158.1 Similar to Kinesin-related protein 11; acc. no. Q6S001 [Pyronema omphalodes CBS 100304]